MPKKTKIIFIVVFVLVGTLMIGGYYFFKNKKGDSGDNIITNIYQKFNPFGSSNDKIDTDNNKEEEEEGSEPETVSKLKKITDFAISGASTLEDLRPVAPKADEIISEEQEEKVEAIRYTEKATGHIYQMYLDKKTSNKISNSTIPGSQETIFGNNSSSVIYRYLSVDNKITSYLATMGATSGMFLNTDILDITLSPDKTKFFYLVKNTKGVVGYIKSFIDGKNSQIFTSSFSEWTPQWIDSQTIFLTTKPSYLVNGSMFSLNINNGTLNKVFGGITGLTTLSNKTGGKILYSLSTEKGPLLGLFNNKTKEKSDLKIYGLPEKCVWSDDNIKIYCAIPNTIFGNEYPDVWYQGIVSFEDRFIEINSETGEMYTLINSQNETPVDAISMFLDKNENKLFFTNKKDYTLWQLDL